MISSYSRRRSQAMHVVPEVGDPQFKTGTDCVFTRNTKLSKTLLLN
jgi:hypothetical protein